MTIQLTLKGQSDLVGQNNLNAYAQHDFDKINSQLVYLGLTESSTKFGKNQLDKMVNFINTNCSLDIKAHVDAHYGKYIVSVYGIRLDSEIFTARTALEFIAGSVVGAHVKVIKA